MEVYFMPKRRVPNRDEFLNYLRAQRQTVGTGQYGQATPIQNPTSGLNKLINTSPTRLMIPNRAGYISQLLKKRKVQTGPVGPVQPLR